MFAGGLEVIPSRVLLDVLAWTGMFVSIWNPPHWKNSALLLSTVCTVLATSGATSRWTTTFPMAPLVTLQLFRRTGSQLRDSRLLYYLSLLFLLLSVGLAVLFPPLRLPRAQAGGPYAVGAVHFFLPIETAGPGGEACSLFNHTQVKVKLLYPTNSTDQSTMPYLSPSIAMEFMQESFRAAAPPELKPYDWLLHHWLLAELPVQRHATLLPPSQQERFPLVAYSHGLMGNADLYSYQAVSLASQGVLVLMVNHLDGSAPIAEHVDGTRIVYNHELIQVWKDGKELEYTQQRRRQTEWRAKELIGATEAILALNSEDNTPPIFKDTPYLNLKGRVQTDSVFFMGHSFGGATSLTAAFRRPDLVNRGGVVAHEPATDWIPDDARMSLLSHDRIAGLVSSHNYTGGIGGLAYPKDTTIKEESTIPVSSIHDLNLLFLFSEQWRRVNWGESHILEEMYQKARLGPKGGIAGFAIIKEAVHNEFSDMCMLTPLWLSRGTGAAGPRNPLETAREIEESTWNFISSVLQKQ